MGGIQSKVASWCSHIEILVKIITYYMQNWQYSFSLIAYIKRKKVVCTKWGAKIHTYISKLSIACYGCEYICRSISHKWKRSRHKRVLCGLLTKSVVYVFLWRFTNKIEPNLQDLVVYWKKNKETEGDHYNNIWADIFPITSQNSSRTC